MLQSERQAKILQLIKDKGFVENKDLQEFFKVTRITIRRDLKELSKQKLIKHVHGGAINISDSSTTPEPLYKTKSFLNINKKEVIGKVAVEMIDDGDTIFFDTGTTTLQVALRLKNKKFKSLTVLTNDIKIAYELCSFNNIKVFVLGGELKNFLYSLYGPYTINFLQDLKADKLFLAADAISNEGISNANIEDVPVKQAMLKSSKYAILVADSSKYGKDAFCKVCGWSQINMVICDNKIPDEYINLFNDKNIDYRLGSLK
ncbi:MAG: DeoR/GlpR family DNA-binding transcription regulator [Candidatus Humimicrobiaceae bacterium]